MGVLLLMDYFALLSQNSKYDRFVVALVESNKVSSALYLPSRPLAPFPAPDKVISPIFCVEADIFELQRRIHRE
jgi:hypothetical protein